MIGVKVGHLPARPPFSHSPVSSGSPASDKKISSEDILESIKNRDAFYEKYVEITNRAIDMYAKAGRRKFALKLHGSLAALDVYVCSFLSDFTPEQIPKSSWTASRRFDHVYILAGALRPSYVDFTRVIDVVFGVGYTCGVGQVQGS